MLSRPATLGAATVGQEQDTWEATAGMYRGGADGRGEGSLVGPSWRGLEMQACPGCPASQWCSSTSPPLLPQSPSSVLQSAGVGLHPCPESLPPSLSTLALGGWDSGTPSPSKGPAQQVKPPQPGSRGAAWCDLCSAPLRVFSALAACLSIRMPV